jgi:glutamate racemase
MVEERCPLLQRDLPIGVFDSGIGGLTVASAIHQELPHERILYFGDTARCPYGNRNPEEVLQFSIQICDFLCEQGVKMLVVACNTATAAALHILERRYPIPVIGVIQPGARAALQSSSYDSIGVIGTVVTVRSGAYEQAIKKHSPNATVYSVACPTFVPLVERGQWEGEAVEHAVRNGLRPLMATNIDALILGCTHYPHLLPAIQRVMGGRVHLISSAHETAVEVKSVLSSRQALSSFTSGVQDRFFTTGDGAKMRVALARWLDVPAPTADLQVVSLGHSIAR